MDQSVSSDSYRELFENSPLPMWVYDSTTLAFLAVNKAAILEYGYSEPEFLKMRLTDIEVAGEAKAGDDAQAKNGVHETRHRRKAGGSFFAPSVSRPVTFKGRAAVLLLRAGMGEEDGRMRAFSDFSLRLSAARTATEAARVLADAADGLVGWEACTFDLFSEGRKNYETILRIRTLEGRRVEGPQEPGGGAPDPFQTPPTNGRVDSSMRAQVRSDGKVIGVLSVQSAAPRAYTEADLSTLQALADYSSGALERIQAEQEAARLNEELEKRVRERTAQLEAINKEMEAFSYSVSHDLRAPLRSIRGFSEVLLERYAPNLDDRGKEFLRRACESSHHMDALIDDLLKLSRVNRSELTLQPVDLSAMVEEIAGELRKNDPGRAVDFVIQPGLKAVGDQRLLRVALDNLVRNAWKFTGKKSPARIEFGQAHEPEPAFFVKDNGAGFNMQYANKLFGVFQRLHSATEFPGTGIGLATVQRIIIRHGGRLWANAEPNAGATFFFSLPSEQPF